MFLSVYLSDAIGTLRTGIDAKTQLDLDRICHQMRIRRILDGLDTSYGYHPLQVAGRDRF